MLRPILLLLILAAGWQLIEVGQAKADPRGLEPQVRVTLLGQLQLPVFHCDEEPAKLWCALIPKDSWSVHATDEQFDSQGWFESSDTLGRVLLF